jgi:hypothetical protein
MSCSYRNPTGDSIPTATALHKPKMSNVISIKQCKALSQITMTELFYCQQKITND